MADASEPIQAVHRKIADSAVAMKQSSVQLTDSADRRTSLAANRTVLAAERTYAAWMRTGLTSLASGIGARALLNGQVPGWLVGMTGTVLVAFAAFCFFAAVWRDRTPVAPPEPDVRRLPRGVLLAVSGFMVLVSAAVLVISWYGVRSGT